jgi:hypothetical protein
VDDRHPVGRFGEGLAERLGDALGHTDELRAAADQPGADAPEVPRPIPHVPHRSRPGEPGRGDDVDGQGVLVRVHDVDPLAPDVPGEHGHAVEQVEGVEQQLEGIPRAGDRAQPPDRDLDVGSAQERGEAALGEKEREDSVAPLVEALDEREQRALGPAQLVARIGDVEHPDLSALAGACPCSHGAVPSSDRAAH